MESRKDEDERLLRESMSRRSYIRSLAKEVAEWPMKKKYMCFSSDSSIEICSYCDMFLDECRCDE